MDNLVGVLAMATLGLAVLIVGLFYLKSLRSGRNMDALKNLSEDGASAHTAVRGGRVPEHLKGADETK